MIRNERWFIHFDRTIIAHIPWLIAAFASGRIVSKSFHRQIDPDQRDRFRYSSTFVRCSFRVVVRICMSPSSIWFPSESIDFPSSLSFERRWRPFLHFENTSLIDMDTEVEQTNKTNKRTEKKPDQLDSAGKARDQSHRTKRPVETHTHRHRPTNSANVTRCLFAETVALSLLLLRFETAYASPIGFDRFILVDHLAPQHICRQTGRPRITQPDLVGFTLSTGSFRSLRLDLLSNLLQAAGDVIAPFSFLFFKNSKTNSLLSWIVSNRCSRLFRMAKPFLSATAANRIFFVLQTKFR